jgi:hypothetical protein
MATIRQRPLFAWQQVDAASDLQRLRLVLEAMPDETLMRTLEQQRGRGRDDYPIRSMWNALLAGIVFQHLSSAALLRELRRNAELRQVCGFDPLLGLHAVPSEDAFGRFLGLVIEQQALVLDLFHRLVAALAQVLPDLGQKLAVDSKAIASAGQPVTDDQKRTSPDGRRDLDADGGVKTYHGQRADGTTWEKVVKWFGYKLHLVVDSTYELPLGFRVTVASSSDTPLLLPLIEELQRQHPDVATRATECAADKAYDSGELKARRFDDHGIRPLIDHRRLWKEEPDEPRPLFPDRVDVFLYDELGRVYCQCPSERRGEDERRPLAFVGFEADRQTLKYRCPAAYYDFECKGRAECERCSPLHVGEYGRVVRVPLSFDRRIFTPTPRPTPKWEQAYHCRTAVERVNSRIDRVLGFEQHFIRGQDKMTTRVTLALVVLLAMALGRINANQQELMRSLIAPAPLAA